MTLHKTIAICSLYLNPRSSLGAPELNDLVRQLPAPFILLGDLNAHNTLLEGNSTDPRGDNVQNFILNNSLCLWNDKSPTYLHPGSGSFTSIDLSICHPSLFLDYQWFPHETTCGSDHFPLILQVCISVVAERAPRWQLHRGNWALFKELCLKELPKIAEPAADLIQPFAAALDNIATRSIPKSSTRIGQPQKPWIDEDCRQSIKLRNRAYQIFYRFPTSANLTNYRLLQAQTRRLIKRKKRTTWKEYVSGLSSRRDSNTRAGRHLPGKPARYQRSDFNYMFLIFC